MAAQPVIIIGAGPGGLILANILYKNNVECVVYDADESAHSRPQGGSLDLSIEDGQAALKAADLFEEWKNVARCEDQQIRFYDKSGTLLFEHVFDPQKVFRPEVDRGQLRDVLLSGLPNHFVQWGHRLERVESNANEGFVCQFSNGKTVNAHILIGADGAFSKVRSLLTTQTAMYSGISYMEWTVSEEAYGKTNFRLVGNEVVFGDRKSFFLQHNSQNTKGYAFLRADEDWYKTFACPQPEDTLKKLSDTYFKDWCPDILQLLKAESVDLNSINLRPVNVLPTGLQWENKSGVTLLGDAAHLMSPFAGEGANQAMADGMNLAEAIIKLKNGDANALIEYEKKMYKTSSWSAKMSAWGLEFHFGEGWMARTFHHVLLAGFRTFYGGKTLFKRLFHRD